MFLSLQVVTVLVHTPEKTQSSIPVCSEHCTHGSEEEADGEGVLREAQTRVLEEFAHTAAPVPSGEPASVQETLRLSPTCALCHHLQQPSLPPLWPTFLLQNKTTSALSQKEITLYKLAYINRQNGFFSTFQPHYENHHISTDES